MTETRTPGRLVMVDQKCDACHKGKMRTGNVSTCLASWPPVYEHTCDNCGHGESFEQVYPYQDLEPTILSRLWKRFASNWKGDE